MKFERNDYLVMAAVLIIVAVVFFILPANLKPSGTHTPSYSQQNSIEQSYDTPQQAPEENGSEQKKEISPLAIFFNLISLALFVVLGFILFKRFKGDDLIFVMIKAKKNKLSGKRFLQVSVYNLGKHPASLNAPTIEFSHHKETKRYVITRVENQVIYPLTIPSNQGHRINIDVEKFYEKVTELKAYKSVRMIYSTASGKAFRSLKAKI